MVIFPIAQGLAATGVAIVAILAWIAIGALFMRKLSVRDILFLPGSLLVGAGLTGAILAVASRVGAVLGGTVAVSALSLCILGLQRRVVVAQLALATREFRRAVGRWPWAKWALVPLPVIAWVYAIAPPRDGDVMRYHLAHVRQIISDGGWKPIADITYAFPFAWSLNYLPFEMLGLPQAAQLVNLGVGLIVFVTLIRLNRGLGNSRMDVLVALLFLAHPFVVRTFASALADGYAILVGTVIAAGLLRLDRANRPTIALLGFSSWIGVGSRYQLVAIAIAATVVIAIHALRSRQFRNAGYFAMGAAGALLLASPFYIANLLEFGNPVWPLMINSRAAAGSYANGVASLFITGFASAPSVAVRVENARELFMWPDLAPLPVFIVASLAAAFWIRDRGQRNVAMFGSLFLLLWGAMSPRLYPTHILPILSCGPILLGGLLERIPANNRARRLTQHAIAAVVVGFVVLSAFVARDYARYAVTGDAREFHRYTWYYGTYDWVNRNTPASARFLVVVLSGHSYYLNRQYRRADPWLSGVVDWHRIASPAALDSLMRRDRYDYLIFDDLYWGQFSGGNQMSDVIHAAISAGNLVAVHRSRDPLYTSRIRRTSAPSNVYVLHRTSPSK